MLAKKTDTILVSFQDTIPRIKKEKNVVYTGTPEKIKRQNLRHMLTDVCLMRY